MTRTIDGRPYFLSLTDTAGQEEYRGLWAASNLRSDAFLLVYDITSAPSLSALDYFMQMIDMECDHRHDSGGIQPVKIVAGNKCDLKDARAITSRQGLEWARSRDCGFMETSAREMVNIEETFARTFPPFPFFVTESSYPSTWRFFCISAQRLMWTSQSSSVGWLLPGAIMLQEASPAPLARRRTLETPMQLRGRSL